MTKNMHNSTRVVLTAAESGAWLKRVLAPVAKDIASIGALGCIAVVFHKPGKLARKAAKAQGLKAPRGKTTVYGIKPAEFAKMFEHDPVTRRWCSTGPGEDEIKVFLASGKGTALFTLSFEGDHDVAVKKEPDVYPVQQDTGAIQ